MTIVEATTPTGTTRAVKVNRETVMNRIHLEIVNAPKSKIAKAYAQVNLTDEEATKLYLALGELLAVERAAMYAEGTRIARASDGHPGTVIGAHPDPEFTRVHFDGYRNPFPVRTSDLQLAGAE